MSKLGIDISAYQTNVNYDKVVDSGIEFAILRVGYGVSYLPSTQRDKQFDNHYNGFKGKIPLGAYYYSYAKKVGDGKKEAENCLKYINGRNFEYPIFYDLEDKVSQGLSVQDLTKIALEFVEVIESAGYQAGIYCSKYWANNELDMSKFENLDVWIASYGSNDGKVPSAGYMYKGRQNIWQYTSRGYVNGINGYVDMNILYDLVDEDITKPEPVIPTPTYSGDAQIKKIQEWLNNEYGTGLNVDGYYGPKTKEALVKGLQTELNRQFGEGLKVDGVFGPKTKAACHTIKNGARGNITKLIQSALYCKGYNTNGVDGIFGNGTEQAVRKFQADKGLKVDGLVGKNTFERLFK